MIPKIVYYCWFGNQMPNEIQKRIETWKQILVDYAFVCINENNFDVSAYEFTQHAYDAQKYAFVSDVARLEFLEKTGGVYLDTDVDVIQSLDIFLTENKLVLSMEYYDFEITGVNVGTIIAPANHPIITQVKDRIIKSTYTTTRPTINTYFNDALTTLKYKDVEQHMDGVHIYTTSTFCKANANSYTVHQYDKTWGDEKTLFQKIKHLIGVLLKKIIGKEAFNRLLKANKSSES